jgi:hypothetical protein
MPELEQSGRRRDGEMEQGTRGAAYVAQTAAGSHFRGYAVLCTYTILRISGICDGKTSAEEEEQENAVDEVRLGSNAICLVGISAQTGTGNQIHHFPTSPTLHRSSTRHPTSILGRPTKSGRSYRFPRVQHVSVETSSDLPLRRFVAVQTYRDLAHTMCTVYRSDHYAATCSWWLISLESKRKS